MTKVGIIVAISENYVIGKDNMLPWHLPEDLAYFKRLTDGHTIIMGRKTWESLGRPLPNRRHIVVTSGEIDNPDIAVARSLGEALELAHSEAPEKIFIIGGVKLFQEGMRYATHMYITRVLAHVEGDTYLRPSINPHEWRYISSTPLETGSLKNPGLKADFQVWQRR